MIPNLTKQIELLRKCDEGRELEDAEAKELVASHWELHQLLCDLQACTPHGNPAGNPLTAEELEGLRFDGTECAQWEECATLLCREIDRYVTTGESPIYGPSTEGKIQPGFGSNSGPDVCETFQYYLWRAQAEMGLEYVCTDEGFPTNGYVQVVDQKTGLPTNVRPYDEERYPLVDVTDGLGGGE